MTTTLLPASSGPFEFVNSEANLTRLDAVATKTAILSTLWNPSTCPAAELPLLAWALSVDHWDASWSVPRQRKVVAEARLYHQRKTTVAGVRMALAYRDAELVDAHLPRHGFFVDRAFSLAEREAWLTSLPEIRVFDPAPFAVGGPARRFVGVNCIARGDARLGRRAILLRDGKETRLAYAPASETGDGSKRLVLPVGKRNALIVGRAGSRRVLSAELGETVLAIRTGSDAYARPAATPGDVGAFVEARRRIGRGATVPFSPIGRGGRRIVAPIAIAQGYLSLRYSDRPGRIAARAPSNVVGRSRVMRPPYTGAWTVDWTRATTPSRLPSGRKVFPSSEPVVASLMGAIADAQAARDNHSITLAATRRLTFADLRTAPADVRFGQRKSVASRKRIA